MLDTPSQGTRGAKLTTPLGQDALVLVRMSGTEGLSELYEFRVEALSNDPAIDATDLIGHGCHVTIETHARVPRHFHGLCTEFRWLGGKDERNHYELTLRPSLWLATRQTDSRIFANKTVEDIIGEVLAASSPGAHEFSLQATPPTLAYCVQYQETNFAFVSRLMERYGLYYFFKHTDTAHTLIITDNQGAHLAATNYDRVPYYPEGEAVRERDHLVEWSSAARLRSSKVAVKDYNHTTASTDLAQLATATVQHGSATNEVYVYPAGHPTSGEGTPFATTILQAERATAERFYGSGTAAGLGAGQKFKVDKDPLPSAGSDYLIVRATHQVIGSAYSSGGIAGLPPYQGSIEAQLLSVQFRAPQRTPWPRMPGPQTAKVVGAEGQEIDVDDTGRILVHFHWERAGLPSCRVRVAQVWAGAGWGAVWIPRIGQEVVVGFVDGDPDRPLVIGAVYNSDNALPAAMPANKTQSTIKSNSSMGGNGFNEIRFEDKAGEEQIYVHAQKDRVTEILNDDSLRVDHDQTIKIKNNRTEEVSEGNETVDVKQGNRTVTIGQGNEELTVTQGNLTTTITQGNETRKLGQGNRSTKLDMGNDELELAMGNQTTKMDLGSQTVEAMQSIELKVGSNSVKIDMMGVTIKGTMVKIEASAMLDMKGSAMGKLDGGGMLMLKGGITMIG